MTGILGVADRGFCNRHGMVLSMPDSSKFACPDTEPVIVWTNRYRLYPGNFETVCQLADTAGACRFVWDHCLADCRERYRMW